MDDVRRLSNAYPRLYPILPNGASADIVLSEDDSPVERAFVSDLVIFYAFDLGDQFELVSNRELARLAVSADRLHEESLENLRKLNLDVQAHRGKHFTMLTAGGNFEAALLLLPEIWNSVREMVGGDIIASVPARDLLIFTGDSNTEDLSALRASTSRMIEKAEKPLSRHFLRRQASAWVPYKGFAD